MLAISLRTISRTPSILQTAPRHAPPRCNFLDDVLQEAKQVRGSNMLVERNVLTQQLGNGIDMHMGSNNVFRNNVIHGGVVTMANNTAVGFFDARQSRVLYTRWVSFLNPKHKTSYTRFTI